MTTSKTAKVLQSAGVEDDLYGTNGWVPEEADAVDAPDWSVQIVKAEKSIFELHRRYTDGRLELRPEFQRDFVWNRPKQVRLVESVLARIPLPAFYLADSSEEKSVVIDGQQRLTTLFRFLEDKLVLRGLDLLPRFEGKKFTKLEPRFQRRVEDTALTVFSVQPGSDPEVKFHLFERLNQGGVNLNAQEIRNGIYRGPGLELVNRLGGKGGLFRHVAGARRKFKRMKAEELALRAVAFASPGLSSYPGDMKVYLNRALLALNRTDVERLAAIEARTEAVLTTIGEVFGDRAFRRFDSDAAGFSRHLNVGLMDALVAGFAAVERPTAFWVAQRDKLLRALIELHEDEEFVAAISVSTSGTSKVNLRTERWREVLSNVAQHHA